MMSIRPDPDPQHCFSAYYFLQPAGLFRNHNEVGKVNLELEENLGTRHTALDEILKNLGAVRLRI
jgi:hypothetical protein